MNVLSRDELTPRGAISACFVERRYGCRSSLTAIDTHYCLCRIAAVLHSQRGLELAERRSCGRSLPHRIPHRVSRHVRLGIVVSTRKASSRNRAARVIQIQRANKAPDPTPGLGTPRAMESALEMRRNEKRGAPSPVVAHLWLSAKL